MLNRSKRRMGTGWACALAGLGLGLAGQAEAKTVLIDFGVDTVGFQTTNGAAPDDPVNFWNNLTATQASSAGQKLNAMVATDNSATTWGLNVTKRFNGPNENGTTTSTKYPSDATRDSLYGNTEAFGGLSNITPEFKLTGLTPGQGYDLTFYASRTGATDNRETLYTVTGNGPSAIASLDVANNVNNTTGLTNVQPNAQGEILIALSPGPANNNLNHFVYLGVLQVAETPEPGAIGLALVGGIAALARRGRRNAR